MAELSQEKCQNLLEEILWHLPEQWQNLLKAWKKQKDCPEAALEKIWFEKFHKNPPKRNYYEVLASVTSKPAISIKKYPMTLLKKFFRILFYVRTLVKEQKELKYLIPDLKFFTKFIRKKLWWSSFLVKLQPATLLKKNSELFSLIMEAIKICFKYILKMFKNFKMFISWIFMREYSISIRKRRIPQLDYCSAKYDGSNGSWWSITAT